MRGVLALVLGMNENMLDEFHPVMALAEHIAESVDPEIWARFYHTPLPGKRAQSVLLYEGTEDHFNPYQTSEALACALNATPVRPAVVRSVLSLGLKGIDPVDDTVSGNVAGGAATSALVQFATTVASDGHFVYYAEPNASTWADHFFSSGMSAQPAVVSKP